MKFLADFINRWKRYCLMISLSFTVVLSTFSQEFNNASSILWEISGKKVKTPSYIFGTMHIISAEKFYFPDTLNEMVKSSELLVMEMGGISNQMELTSKLLLSDTNLFDLFTTAQQDSIFDFITSISPMLNKESIEKSLGKFKPIILSQLITQSMIDGKKASYEIRLETIAREENLPIVGLETIEEQFAIFESIPISEQVHSIMEGIRNIEKNKKYLSELEDVYLSQDLKALHTFIQNDSSVIMKYEVNFLKNRNEKWIPLIKKHIKKNKSFIAVGAAHLAGPNNVIELLRNEGYTLTPVRL